MYFFRGAIWFQSEINLFSFLHAGLRQTFQAFASFDVKASYSGQASPTTRQRWSALSTENKWVLFSRVHSLRKGTPANSWEHVKNNWKQEHVLRSRRLFNSLRLHANSINQVTYFTYLPRPPIPQTRGLFDGVSLEKWRKSRSRYILF